MPLETVEEESQPLNERLATLIYESKQRLVAANGLLALGGISIEQTTELAVPSQQTFVAARNFRDALRAHRQSLEDGDDN